jgi:hypothetical protein
MDLHDIDERLEAAKAKWDHGEAPDEPTVLALIRAAEDMRGRLILPTIRVVEKGDFDSQMMLRVVGPFDTEAARDAELARLKKLPMMTEGAWLEASTMPPSAAEQSITPEVSARVRHCNELFEELGNS